MSDERSLTTDPSSPVAPWAGVWIAEDIESICHGVRDGSWIEGSLCAVSAGLDALALVTDPAGVLLQYGVAWIIEHVEPLRDALDLLAGDPARIAAFGRTWQDLSVELRERADDLDRSVRWDTAEWTGAAADAYRLGSGYRRDALLALAEAANLLAAMTEAAGFLIASLRLPPLGRNCWRNWRPTGSSTTPRR